MTPPTRAHLPFPLALSLTPTLHSPHSKANLACTRQSENSLPILLDRQDLPAHRRLGDEALGRLEEHNPRLAQVVELRVFTGMTIEETAQTLSVSPDTVKRAWKEAKKWLLDYFQDNN